MSYSNSRGSSMTPYMNVGSQNHSSNQSRTYRNGAIISSQPTVYQRTQEHAAATQYFKGPVITVFVGNISEKVSEVLIKRVLCVCGSVVSWKRVSTFGFCEYDGPTDAMRAIRLLSDLEIDGKKILAKVDAKHKLLLEDLTEKESKDESNKKILNKHDDEQALNEIERILVEHRHELNDLDANVRVDEIFGNRNKNRLNRQDEVKINKTLQETNIEEEKLDLISTEIGKFRKKAEADEHKKEREREKESKNKRKYDGNKTDSDSEKDWDTSNMDSADGGKGSLPRKDKNSDTSPKRKDKEKEIKELSRLRSKERDREIRDRDIRDREIREREIRDREARDREVRDRELREREKDLREKEREREKDRERERKVINDRDENVLKNIKDIQRGKEIEEEARERKKIDKKAREKEDAYQQRLFNWEQREKRKAKDYEKFFAKEALKAEEREEEAKRLKEFLEDYDDERDDEKYYKGRDLQHRLAERVREADLDAKDRNREQEELEELRSKIFNGQYENPAQEYEKAKKEHDQQYKPNILIEINAKNTDRLQKKNREKTYTPQSDGECKELRLTSNTHISEIDLTPRLTAESCKKSSNRNTPDYGEYVSSSSRQNDLLFSLTGNTNNFNLLEPSDSKEIPAQSGISLNLGGNSRKKKLESARVFNTDDDNEALVYNRKRKLIRIDDEDSAKKIPVENSPPVLSVNPNEEASHSTLRPNEVNAKKDEKDHNEKRRHIKTIIDRIPTQKEDLFNYKLDHNEIDHNLMDRKIRPWINKKIIEYIGEPEPTLVDFICSKVLAGSSPQSILDDVQMVLDEEAEVFVIKMWRLLIYEIDAKKIGLGK